ncbi:MAG: RelA/SpoT domain-containing protein [Ruminococcus sp.]|nr:RelA/SpoT domain-containing protein [Ruminococcus sp.]
MKEEYLEELAYLEAYEMQEILKSFLDTKYDKDYILEFRIKSLDKIKLKQRLYAMRYGYFELLDVPDIIGFRIAIDTEEDVQLIASLIDYYFRPTRIVDFFEKPKETGYKAYNYFFENEEIGTEIQIMTKEMRDWTNSTHEEHDERKYGAVLERTKV